MTEFESQTTLDVVVEERALRSARRTIEDELSDVEVGVNASGASGPARGAEMRSDGGGGGGGRQRRRRRREHRWARQDNSNLEDLLEAVRGLEMGGGGGGGILGDLLGVGGGAAGGALAGKGIGIGAAGAGIGFGAGELAEGIGEAISGTGDFATGVGEGLGESLGGAGEFAQGVGEGVGGALGGVGDALDALTIDELEMDLGDINLHPEFRPEFNPRFDPSFHPEFNPEFDPEFHAEFHPQFNPEFNPEIQTEVDVSPEFDLPDLNFGSGGGEVTIAGPNPLPVEDVSPTTVAVEVSGTTSQNGGPSIEERRNDSSEDDLFQEKVRQIPFVGDIIGDVDAGLRPSAGDPVIPNQGPMATTQTNGTTTSSGSSSSTTQIEVTNSPTYNLDLDPSSLNRLVDDIVSEIESSLDRDIRNIEEDLDDVQRDLENLERDIRRGR